MNMKKILCGAMILCVLGLSLFHATDFQADGKLAYKEQIRNSEPTH